METYPATITQSDSATSIFADVAPPTELVEALVEMLGKDTRKESTLKSYASDVRAFERFAQGAGIPDASGRPATPLWVASWAMAMNIEGLAFATIQRRLRGLGADHRLRGHADPTTHPDVVATLNKIRNVSDRQQKQAQALRSTDIKAIAAKVDDSTLAGARDKALILLGFACALRVSELVKLDIEHIAISDDRIALTIHGAKTSKKNEVQHVIAACSEDDDLCPVDAVRDWLKLAGIKSGAAFRGITRHDTVRSSAISTRAVGDIIKDRSKEAGVIGWADVSSHSLRRGWATEAAAQNVPQAIIKQHGRWKTDASAASAARYVDAAGSESALAATRAVIGGIRFAEAMAAE